MTSTVFQWMSRQTACLTNHAVFIVFEGIDGSGKSTQIELLAKYFRLRGISYLVTAEPSRGPVGRKIRSLDARPAPDEEARFFAEDRKHHVEEVVCPALERGITVLSDRYVYSSVAYQGARGVDVDTIVRLNQPFTIAPDVIFLLEIPVEAALERILANRAHGGTIFEVEENLRSVDRIYRRIEDPLIRRIDATLSKKRVHAEILRHLRSFSLFQG